MPLKYLSLWAVVSFYSFAVFGQEGLASDVYEHANHQTVEKYQPDDRLEHLVLASDFSKGSVQQIPFTERRIVKIDLVYTTYTGNERFDQKKLDVARLQSLIAINPGIVENQFFEWNIIGQTGCNSGASCLNFFHGFVIYYEDYFTKETTKLEIDSIEAELSGLQKMIEGNQDKLTIDYDRIQCIYPESYYTSEYLTKRLKNIYQCVEDYKARVFFEAELDFNGKPTKVNIKGNLFPCKAELGKRLEYIMGWKRGLIIGNKQYPLTVTGYVDFPLKRECVAFTGFKIDDALIKKYKMLQQYEQCVAYRVDTTYTNLLAAIEQRTVLKALLRNRWNPELFVVDVTASMNPYTSDLMKWIKLASQGSPKSYVFFNDGNDKPTSHKAIGHTGGLYFVRTNQYEIARKKMFDAMSNGGGGDLPENNFEALMAGVNQVQPTGNIVMIADNYSFPRDEVMLSRFRGKLRIVLCRTERGVNTDYLNLAKKHGFTLHTYHTDVYDLSSDVTIDGLTYRLVDGKYHLIR